ncbi:hypothetical protein B0H11DRAFT_1905926 [Mycena galericulata]|nr:hypothetical protein B0H11DRAFT_1905926 [Mycena galericulata]
MPKKSRAQEAALGRNLEPLYTALVPACCLHRAQSHGCEHEKCGIHKTGSHEVPTGTVFTEKPDPERYFWKYWVCRPRGKNKRMSSVDAHLWAVSKMTSETSVLLLEDGDGDRMFIVMRETLDYAIGIVLRRLTAIQGMTDVGLDLRFNLQNQSRR